MRRSTSFLLGSGTLALVLMLTTLVGAVTASSTTAPAGAAAGAPVAAANGTLCIVKFNDLDGDGKQGPNEPALSGWVFVVKDVNGNVVGTIGTAPGLPRCIDLPAGTYTVTETPQSGWAPTTNGGATQTVTVVAGQTTTVTFGNHQAENGRICVVKFNDLDGDGKQGPNEPTLSGWVFTIKDANGNVVGTITTSATGAPNCINLPAGTYTVTETAQAGWTPTTNGGLTQTVTVVPGQTTTVTFGNHRTEHGQLCIVKFNDLNGDGKQGPNEPTLVGWVFTITDASGNVVGTITTGDLAANCIDLPAGTYTVTETPQAGWTPTTFGGLTQTVTVVAGQTTIVTFGNHRAEIGRICILKFNDLNGNGKQDPGEPLLPNWVFTVKDSSNTVVGTLTSGMERVCIDVKPGTYTVTETPQPGWAPTTPGGGTQTVTVVAGQTTTVTFGNHQGCCLTFTFFGGKIDNFSLANGLAAEPVTPVSITATPAYFDATKAGLPFAHRFYLGQGNCIASATLEIKIKALSRTSTNDTLRIRVPGGGAWAKPISAISPTGTWAPPTVKTVLFNLGAMPSGGGTANLIPTLNSIRTLDVNIQDDTSVDYIKLVVVFCECVRG